jgi:hypothetical protein
MKRKSLPRVGASLLVALGLASGANAAFISGNVLFGGLITLDNSVLDLATQVSSWGSQTVTLGDGDFTGLTGNPVSFVTPWKFSDQTVNNLWSVGGFTFNLTSSMMYMDNPNTSAASLHVIGTGMVMGNQYDPTPGTWSFTTQEPSVGNRFTFSASSAVPDGGTTVAMFGFSLLGLYGARRKFGSR